MPLHFNSNAKRVIFTMQPLFTLSWIAGRSSYFWFHCFVPPPPPPLPFPVTPGRPKWNVVSCEEVLSRLFSKGKEGGTLNDVFVKSQLFNQWRPAKARRSKILKYKALAKASWKAEKEEGVTKEYPWQRLAKSKEAGLLGSCRTDFLLVLIIEIVWYWWISAWVQQAFPF